MPFKPGIYEHYKGRYYEVLGTSLHSETREVLVLYKPLYGYPEQRDFQYFVRPLKMFEEIITVKGIPRPRFQYIRPVPQHFLLIDDNVYGLQEISDPLAIDIINTPQMQRLKQINQYGVYDLLDPKLFTSRFDHCVGVYLLLHHLGASREEQISGLLHDISHTAFSHVADYIFNDQEGQTIHENFHHQVIFESAIPSLLTKAGMDPQHVANEQNFSLLEQPTPNLCADRVDYFLRDAQVVGIITKEEVQKILSHLQNYSLKNDSHLSNHQGMIVLNDSKVALFYAQAFLRLVREFYTSSIQAGSYQLMGNILKIAFEKKILQEPDLFGTDREVLEKLHQSKNPKILQMLNTMSYQTILNSTKENYTFQSTSKARYVDPLVLVNHQLIRTSQLYPELIEEIEALKRRCKDGYYILIKEMKQN